MPTHSAPRAHRTSSALHCTPASGTARGIEPPERLQHVEHASRVIIESRGGSDKHDRRTRDRLRRSRSITAAFHVDHARKQDDERLWLPDFIAGSYIGAVSDAGSEPWKIVSESHLTEVIPLDSE